MFDFKTGQRVIVHIHDEYGPYIRASTYDMAGTLEDIFDEKLYVLYWITRPDGLEADGGCDFFFGNAADEVKIQRMLDSIKIMVNQ